jgi:arylsulfatase A-like enzyme
MLVAGALALALGGALALGADRVQAQSRPNVVLIVADDLNVGTLATMVAKGMMPNVKAQFVDKGFTFTEAFATRALGVPSRATSLTGQYAHNHGVLGHANETIGGISRFNASSTVATWLRASGYRTGYVGKYLAGYGTWTAPTYVPPGWDNWLGTLEPNYHSMFDYAVNYNGTVIDFGPINQATSNAYYQTDLITVQAGSFIAASPLFTKPFFLYVSPAAINMEFPFVNECADGAAAQWGGNFWGATGRPAARHLDTIYGNTTDFPLPQSPSFNEADVSDKPDWMQGNPQLTPDDVACLQKNYWRRLEMLRSLDDLVGYVFQALQATGTLSNTTVILTSDNGLYYGQHRLGEKSSAFEESIRVPLLVRVPWRSTPATVNKLVLNNDLAPTVANLASVTPSHAVDGRSFLPLMQNPAHSPWRTGFLVEHWAETTATVTSAPTLFAVRTEPALPRLLAVHPTAASGHLVELYDLTLDPNQLENVASAPSRAAEVSRLTFWMELLSSCRGIGCQVVENFVSAAAQ